MTATPLEEYIEYYKNLKKPGFAVLVTGEWGIGKTHQVKNAIEKKDRYYVSLFGCSTIAEVHSEVFFAAISTSSWWRNLIEPIVKIGELVGGRSRFVAAAPSILQAAIKTMVNKNKIIIFDDLERSELPSKEQIGALNYYVEHLGCKVIVIAHDGKLVEGLKNQKEKVFGQFFRVEMQTQAAFDAFVNEVESDCAKKFIKDHQEQILDVFSQSGVHSLRILRHVIADISRLVAILDPDHLKHRQAMAELISLFCAFDIELRNDGLSEKCLEKRASTLRGWELRQEAAKINGSNGSREKNTLEKPKLVTASEKYNEKYSIVDMANPLLSDELLVQFLVSGRYDKVELKSCLDNSIFFATPKGLPPWKIIWDFDKFDDGIVESAVVRMNTYLKEFAVTNPGEIVHTFMLKIMMAENGISKNSIETEVQNAKEYIDSLLSLGLLPPATTLYSEKHEFDTSHDGYGYWGHEEHNDEFKQIMGHLEQARDQALEKSFPKETQRLLCLMHEKSEAFMDEVSHTYRGNGKYAVIPILLSIQEEEFVEKWLSAPKKNWSDIWMAFKNRYQSTICEGLKSEQGWVINVGKVFQQKVSKAKGFSRVRIQSAYESGVKPIIDAINNAKQKDAK